MKNTIIILFIGMFLSACATASKTYTPDGDEGYVIACSGIVLSWGDCYKKAGKLCGARGYEIIGQAGDQGGVVTAGQYGLMGGSVMDRNLIIK